MVLRSTVQLVVSMTRRLGICAAPDFASNASEGRGGGARELVGA